MKNISTKLAVLIIGFMVFISTAQPQVAHAQAVENVDVLVDADMEAPNMDAWRTWGRANPLFTLEKSRIRQGNELEQHFALHMNAPATAGGVQQINIPVQAGKTYLFTMRYRLLSGTLRPLFGIRSSNSDFENRFEILSKITPNDPDAYWDYARYVTIPNNFAGDFRFVLTAQNGESFIEEAHLFDASTLNNQWIFGSYGDDSKLIRDAYMGLTGTSLWRAWGSPSALVKDGDPSPSDEWDYALRLDTRGTNAGVQQTNIPVRAGQSYRLSFSYRVSSGILQPLLGVNTSNSDFEKLVVGLRPNNAWQQYQRDFTVPLNFAGDFRAVFILKNGEGWIDNVTLTPVVNGQISGTLSIQDVDRGDWVGLPDHEIVLLGEEQANLGTFTFAASAEEDISVSAVRFVIEDTTESPRLINYTLYKGNEVLGVVQGIFDLAKGGEQVYFENINFIVPRNQNVQLTLKADSISEAQGGISTANGYLVTITPKIGNIDSVEAVGMSSAEVLSGANLHFGPAYGGPDRDFQQMGKFFDIQATNVTSVLSPNQKVVTSGPEQTLVVTRVTNVNNPSMTPATLSKIKFTMRTDGFAPADNRNLQIYNESSHQLLGQLQWGQALLVSQDDMGGNRQFEIPLNNFILAAGQTVDLGFRFDLDDAQPNLSVVLSGAEVEWSDGILQTIRSSLDVLRWIIVQ